MRKRPGEVGWLRLALGTFCSVALARLMVTMPDSVFPLWARVGGLVLGVLIGCLVAADVIMWILNALHRRSERIRGRERGPVAGS